MFKLIWANIKMTFRDKQAVFWSLAFPLMFIIIFGLFDFTKMGNANYVVFDKAESELSQQFQKGLEEIEFLKKQDPPENLDIARQQLQNGDIDIIIVVPEDFENTLPSIDHDMIEQMVLEGDEQPEVPAFSPIEVFYDESNTTVNQVALGVVDKFIDQMNMGITNTPVIFSYTAESVQSKDVKYIDIIMPGILAMAIMMSAVIGISTGISQYRERKLLKRLSATPLKVRDFLMAEVVSYLFLNLIQISLIILVAQLAFGVNIYGSIFLIYVVCIIGSLIFLNLGFAVAGYAKNTKTAESLSQIVTMPMMFFSGVFFPPEALPAVIGSIVKFLPLTPMIEALRAVSVNGGVLQDIWTQLAFMGGWIVLSFLIAWKVFKFKD
ncbi:ABC transporter permease [Patescibacteria group bacterium]|nr:ABC transporter permease [Patescibacteria group bacterium]MBU1075436.1 ABC transporter permease [Patescibacteria group bacterium]MBU1952005.1 ABC transporter permease [Patescibacteria group bacterium]